MISIKIIDDGHRTKTPLLFTDKPLFGLDIGRSSLKIVQLSHQATKIQKGDKQRRALSPPRPQLRLDRF